jgi:hypothetical protein
LKKCWTISLLLLFILHDFLIAKQYDESTLKSVFIEKFTRFIEWPSGSDVTDINTPFIIGIYGDTEIKEKLEDIYKDEYILNKTVEIKELALKSVSDCHILIIADNKIGDMDKIQNQIKGSPVLTIGESEDFAEKGSMIAYTLKDNKIRFIINQKKAVDSGFKISHLLLNLAEVINPVNKR